jgi:ribonuclease VapC
VIVVDTSAVVAILKKEAEAERFARAIAGAERRFISAVTLLEASLVMIGRGTVEAAEDVDALVERAAIEVVPFDQHLAVEARVAFVKFGKGRHPAALNFGDCISYALARVRGLPLLCKGDDFAKTDIDRAAA